MQTHKYLVICLDIMGCDLFTHKYHDYVGVYQGVVAVYDSGELAKEFADSKNAIEIEHSPYRDKNTSKFKSTRRYIVECIIF